MIKQLLMKDLVIALRPKQWVKNLLIFMPLIFGQVLFCFPTNLNVFIAFILFCMTTSSVYLVNDIFDIERDKLHPTKCLRTLASWYYLTYHKDFYFDVNPLMELGWKPKYSNDEMFRTTCEKLDLKVV